LKVIIKENAMPGTKLLAAVRLLILTASATVRRFTFVSVHLAVRKAQVVVLLLTQSLLVKQVVRVGRLVRKSRPRAF
jgi:hypothetical protein